MFVAVSPVVASPGPIARASALLLESDITRSTLAEYETRVNNIAGMYVQGIHTNIISYK